MCGGSNLSVIESNQKENPILRASSDDSFKSVTYRLTRKDKRRQDQKINETR